MAAVTGQTLAVINRLMTAAAIDLPRRLVAFRTQDGRPGDEQPLIFTGMSDVAGEAFSPTIGGMDNRRRRSVVAFPAEDGGLGGCRDGPALVTGAAIPGRHGLVHNRLQQCRAVGRVRIVATAAWPVRCQVVMALGKRGRSRVVAFAA